MSGTPTETHCRGCGDRFATATDAGTVLDECRDCPGCHLCLACAWPDCPVCGDAEGVRLNAEQGKSKPDGFGAVPWTEHGR